MVAKSRKNTSKKHRAVRKKILKTRKHKGGNFLGNLLGSGDGKGEKPEPPADTSATVHYKDRQHRRRNNRKRTRKRRSRRRYIWFIRKERRKEER